MYLYVWIYNFLDIEPHYVALELPVSARSILNSQKSASLCLRRSGLKLCTTMLATYIRWASNQGPRASCATSLLLSYILSPFTLGNTVLNFPPVFSYIVHCRGILLSRFLFIDMVHNRGTPWIQFLRRFKRWLNDILEPCPHVRKGEQICTAALGRENWKLAHTLPCGAVLP